MRNIATTHLLDRLSKAFGEVCYEVPVGFKHISSKMEDVDAVIGGESSGGLTIRGHIKGKDGIFAGSLLVEMICATGKMISELLDEIHHQFGEFHMEETNYRFSEEQKNKLVKVLFEEKRLPEFGYGIKKISYIDGCKVYFENDGWIVTRFSGTEPLVRILSEMPSKEESMRIIGTMREFLKL